MRRPHSHSTVAIGMGALTLSVALLPPQPGMAQVVRDSGSPASAAPVARPAGINTVTGIVMSDERDSRPVRRALVSLKRTETGLTRAAVTDDDGRFAASGVVAGRYTVTVTKAGWVTSIYGAKRSWRPPGVAISIVNGQPSPPIEIRMMRGAVITGRLVDPRGNPLRSAEPRLLELRTVAGQPQLKEVTYPQEHRQLFTDDRGEYRFYGLPPGTYIVEAAITAATNTVTWNEREAARRFVPTFFPGVADATEATPIVLEPGQERSGVDFIIRADPTVSISGRVIGPDGLPNSGARIWAASASGGLSGPLDWTRRVFSISERDGTFTLPELAPGRYTVTADSASAGIQPNDARDLYAVADVTLGGEGIRSLTLALRKGQTIAGRVSYDTDGAAPQTQTFIRLYQWGDDPDVTTTPIAGLLRPDATGAFSFPGLKPGRYALVVSKAAPDTPSRWALRSATSGADDVLRSGLEVVADREVSDLRITLTDRGGELSGRLLDQRGQPAPEYYVFAFPADRALWHRYTPMMRPPARPGTDGRYRLAPLPPGDYNVVALTEFEDLDYLDPAVLEQLLPGAMRVTLGERETRVQDIALR